MVIMTWSYRGISVNLTVTVRRYLFVVIISFASMEIAKPRASWFVREATFTWVHTFMTDITEWTPTYNSYHKRPGNMQYADTTNTRHLDLQLCIVYFETRTTGWYPMSLLWTLSPSAIDITQQHAVTFKQWQNTASMLISIYSWLECKGW